MLSHSASGLHVAVSEVGISKLRSCPVPRKRTQIRRTCCLRVPSCCLEAIEQRSTNVLAPPRPSPAPKRGSKRRRINSFDDMFSGFPPCPSSNTGSRIYLHHPVVAAVLPLSCCRCKVRLSSRDRRAPSVNTSRRHRSCDASRLWLTPTP